MQNNVTTRTDQGDARMAGLRPQAAAGMVIDAPGTPPIASKSHNDMASTGARIMDTKNSKKIARDYLNRSWELYRFQTHFSGTWKAKAEDLFRLFCPAGEADWIPGWTAEVLHSDRGGYVSDKCIFKTDETNTAWPPGYWCFTGYKKNELIEVVIFLSDWIMRLKLVVQDNQDGTITGTWYFKTTATTKAGNKVVEKFQKNLNKIQRKALPIAIGHYFSTGKKIKKPALLLKILHASILGKREEERGCLITDKTESRKMAQAYLNRKLKLKRYQTHFSGTWKTTLDDFFPLLCPCREADWIPGWTSEILYSEAEGFVSPEAVFRTDETNTAWGPGLWYITGYEKNTFIEALRFDTDTIMQMRVETKENGDGTVTGAWTVTNSAITESGNRAVQEFEEKLKGESQRLPRLIGHYLETGSKQNKQCGYPIVTEYSD